MYLLASTDLKETALLHLDNIDIMKYLYLKTLI